MVVAARGALRSNIVAEPAVVDQLGACKPASKLTDPAEVADADPVEARRTLRDAHAPVEVLPVPALDAGGVVGSAIVAIVNPADALVGRSGAPRAAHPPEVSSANLLVSGGACIAARPGVKIPAAHAVDAGGVF